MVEAFARAKINLTLHITGQRADGYHLLDSLVVFADIGDRLWLDPSAQMKLDVTGEFAGGVPTDATNIVWKAAHAAGQICHIRLQKNLPHGAGLGGGSADAAAVLRALDAQEHAANLGADVPVCCSSAPQRMQGIGEGLTPAWPVPFWDIVLINPRVCLLTIDVFKALKNKDNAAMNVMPGGYSKANFLTWLGQQRNDLQDAACRLVPAIEQVLFALKDAKLARMSGSGTTCFGLYNSQIAAQQAAREIAVMHPEWWVQCAQTIGNDP